MRNDNIGHGLKSLGRDHITMKYLTHTWAVLTIPSPLDFIIHTQCARGRFRDDIISVSGN